ncbi:hypothetical protein RISK_005668 [Rhodopirellula islandica]|uniref:Transmembrane protein n=1 Tax=Rhodopirellula islandica TaxID=595434 RepID=A0A0J1B792_RHOIS|nr:hypothetical protein RISK_005668 [Rhodopirellula islandica]
MKPKAFGFRRSATVVADAPKVQLLHGRWGFYAVAFGWGWLGVLCLSVQPRSGDR